MLESANFNLRHVTKSDIAKYAALLNDASLRGDYLPMQILSPDILEKRFIETSLSTSERETLLIVDKADNILGSTVYFKSCPYYSGFELGYHLFSLQHRGAGITTAAVRLLTAYLFNTKEINRLEIKIHPQNAASEKVAIKCGFLKEGVARGATFNNGKYIDLTVYGLVRSDWR